MGWVKFEDSVINDRVRFELYAIFYDKKYKNSIQRYSAGQTICPWLHLILAFQWSIFYQFRIQNFEFWSPFILSQVNLFYYKSY